MYKRQLYPFGHGLSYTSFSYGKLTLEEKADKIIARLSVTNTGSRTADEVVQLYVHKEKSRVKQPVMQLKSFVRLKELAPGETAEAELVVNREELRYYDVISEAMLLESGDYTFMADASSGDIRQQALSLIHISRHERPVNRNKLAAYGFCNFPFRN